MRCASTATVHGAGVGEIRYAAPQATRWCNCHVCNQVFHSRLVAGLGALPAHSPRFALHRRRAEPLPCRSASSGRIASLIASLTHREFESDDLLPGAKHLRLRIGRVRLRLPLPVRGIHRYGNLLDGDLDLRLVRAHQK